MIALKVVVLCLAAGCIAAAEAPNKPPPAEILSDVAHVREDGYDFEYKTSDGVSRQENAELITVGDRQGIAVRGSYSYTAPDGQEYEVTFTADDKGYKPIIRVASGGQQ
ncbi:hypothetical protein K1T71_004515 [Dendrolimus kikuchii]|uniref:Uncharacterized protein n=1 Tax=Dendrolimus kikuchii TaxID=765133 RepID=A0ACC1D7N6_9NEOP|nr:hypothetical protein K1T71_004515 [Dendrolimus kikuchii]